MCFYKNIHGWKRVLLNGSQKPLLPSCGNPCVLETSNSSAFLSHPAKRISIWLNMHTISYEWLERLFLTKDEKRINLLHSLRSGCCPCSQDRNHEGFFLFLMRRKCSWFICTTLIAKGNNIYTYVYLCIMLQIAAGKARIEKESFHVDIKFWMVMSGARSSMETQKGTIYTNTDLWQ